MARGRTRPEAAQLAAVVQRVARRQDPVEPQGERVRAVPHQRTRVAAPQVQLAVQVRAAAERPVAQRVRPMLAAVRRELVEQPAGAEQRAAQRAQMAKAEQPAVRPQRRAVQLAVAQRVAAVRWVEQVRPMLAAVRLAQTPKVEQLEAQQQAAGVEPLQRARPVRQTSRAGAGQLPPSPATYASTTRAAV